ncbi:hypothetical protein M3Y99_00616800 [Aphelenchoides fujianensis]|nr:hypothetical protein M3Y99_00616800 [Aphelenchoides fujianensis]
MLRTLAAVALIVGAVVGQYVTRSSPPRFKQSVRRHQYTYLGDTAKFKCDAVGRPMPKAHWYRNGVYANYSFMQERPRIQEKGMELEIRRVEVGDKGQWACRVWNSEGSIMRNFTLHIIDYCDFYLTSEAEATNAVTSESCLCEWISTDDPAFDDDNEILDFRGQYEKENEVTKFRTTAQLSPCRTPNCEDEDVEQYLKSFHRRSEKDPAGEDSSARDFVVPAMSASHYPINTPLDTEQKLQRARAILKERIPVLRQQHDEGIRTDVDEFEEGGYGALKQDRFVAQADTQPTDEGFAGELVDSTREPQAQALVSSGGEASSDPAAEMTTTRRWSPIWTTRSWKPPASPPTSAKRTSKRRSSCRRVERCGLNCKAGGIPEPQVIWRKDHVEISTDTERKSGSIYRIRKWSLELEDAAEGDSGHYTCDVFNSIGSIRRDFRVDVRDRIRARPIILPNVLVNKTVDVNGTVNFTCQVLSDLVPHVVWIRLVRLNGSYIRWDERQNRNVFNFIDMSTVKKAHIFHDNQSKQYSLLIRNVSVEDQGIYSCVAGSSLGISMANASLTVNEFRGMTLPTDHPGPSWHFIYTLFLVLLIMSLICCFTLAAMYYFFNKRVRKDGLQNMEKMTVVITKKPKEGDVWSDLASSYTITVEPVLGKGQSNRTRGEFGDVAGLRNTAGIDDHYMGTEDGVQTTLNGNEERRLSRPLSAPGLRSIQKAQGLAKHSAKSSLEWDGLFDFGRLDSVKTKRSMDRLEHSTHNNSQTIYTMPLLNSIPSASTSEHNQTSLSNTETDYHEAIPYANIHEYMNDNKRQNGEHSAGSTSNPNKELPPHKLSARITSLNIPKLSDSSTHLDDSKNVYEVIGNGHLKNEPDEKKPQMPRSQSVDSQSSSGRGGSSAMSSAEGLGAIAEFSQLQLPLNENGTHSSDSKTP